MLSAVGRRDARLGVALLAVVLIVALSVAVWPAPAAAQQTVVRTITRAYAIDGDTEYATVTFPTPIQSGVVRLWLSGDFNSSSETYTLWVQGVYVWSGWTGYQDSPPRNTKDAMHYVGQFNLPSAAVGQTSITITGQTSSGVDNGYNPAAYDWIEIEAVCLSPQTPGRPSLGGGSPSRWNVQVAWSTGGNQAGTTYELWRKTFNASGNVVADQVIYSGTATSFTTTDQQAGRYYTYRVRAGISGLWSAFSAETAYWTVSSPSVVSLVGGLKVTWPAVYPGVTTQVLLREVGGSWSVAATATGSSYDLQNLNPTKQYEVALRPVLPSGGNAWQSDAAGPASPRPYTPDKPVLGGGDPVRWNVRVSWGTGGNPSGVTYELWRKTFNPDGSLARDERIYSGTETAFVTSDQVPARYYTYRVRAVAQGSYSSWSGETAYWTVSTPAVVPVAGGLRVSWSGVYPDVSTVVLVREEGGQWQQAGTTSQTSLTVTGLNCLKSYYVALEPVLPSGGDAWRSDEAGPVSPLVARPAAPVLGGGSPAVWNVTVAWDSGGNPDGVEYELWRKTLGPEGQVFSDEVIYFGTVRSFTTTDQVSGRYYLYRVRAYAGGSWSEFSAETSYWTAPAFSSVSPGAGSVSLTWPKVMNGLTYRVRWSPEGGSWQTATTQALSYTVPGLDPRLRYTFFLSPVLPAGGNDWWAGGDQVMPLAYAPGAEPLTAAQDSITASWSASGNPPGIQYLVELRKPDGSVVSSSGWVTSLTWTFGGLPSGTQYRAWAKARNGAGVETSWVDLGESWTVPATPGAPVGVVTPLSWSNAAGRGGVQLSWAPVQGASGYAVWVFDGNQYRRFDVGPTTSWDSGVEKVYPAESWLDAQGDNTVSADPFNHSRAGEHLRDTPNKLYRKTKGTEYDSAHSYWFRVSAYNPGGESPRGDACVLVLPNRTDVVAPDCAITLNEGQSVAGGGVVVVRVDAVDPPRANHTLEPDDDCSGLAAVQLSNDGKTWSEWMPFAPQVVWQLDTTEFGEKRVYARVRDVAGNVSQVATDTINYYLADFSAPVVELKIDQGAWSTTSRVVQLEVKVRDDLSPAALLKMRVSEDFEKWPSGWEPYRPYTTWTLSDGDGLKTVYVEVQDAAGNIGHAFAQVVLRTRGSVPVSVPEVFGAVTGMPGTLRVGGEDLPAVFVRFSEVKVRLLVPEGSQIQYSLDGMRWLSPEPAVAEKMFSLPDWEGMKTVYCKLADGSVYVLRFVLDNTPPEVEAGWLGGATVAPGGQAVLVLDAWDNFTRQQDLQVSLDAGVTWRAYAPEIPVSLGGSGYRTVVLVVKDQAGNAVQRTLGIFVP